jgi:VPDSG-CTERM motif
MKKIIFGLFAGAAAFSASAIPVPTPTYFTYTFEADAGQPTGANGSWITIENNGGTFTLTDWNLIDTDPFDLTPLNSSVSLNPSPGISDITSADSSGWSGQFWVVVFGWPSPETQFGGYANIISIPFLPPVTGVSAGSGGTSVVNAQGAWQYTPAGVPDGGATLGLLGMGLAGLFALRRRFAG